jgi:hypothetical protein
LPNDAEKLQADLTVSVAPSDIATTAHAVVTMFSGTQYIGIDLADVFAVAGGKTGGIGQALVLQGTADKATAYRVREWIEIIRANEYPTRSMLIIQVLREMDEDAFSLQPFSDFCDAALMLCNIEDAAVTACGMASISAVVVIAFHDTSF